MNGTPRAETIEGYSGDGCRQLDHYPPAEQCSFVKSEASCYDPKTYFQYLIFLVCTFNSSLTTLIIGTFIVLLFVLIIFLILGTTADEFFVPNVGSICDIIRMSEHLAGVTLLALGNSFPDILTMVVGVSSHGEAMIVGELLGSGLFVSCFVQGCIMVLNPSRLIPGPLLMNLLFYFCAILWFYSMFSDKKLYAWEPMFLCCLYVLYIFLQIFIAFMGWEKEAHREIYEHQEHMASYLEKTSTSGGISKISRGVSNVALIKTASSLFKTGTLLDKPQLEVSPLSAAESTMLPRSVVPKSQAATVTTKLDLVIKAERANLLYGLGMDEEARLELQGHSSTRGVTVDGTKVYMRADELIKEMLQEINPVDRGEWDLSNAFFRFFIILRAPLIIILKLTIPVVNHAALNNGWCKLLNCMHCLTSLMLISYNLGVSSYSYNVQILVWPIIATIGIIAAVVVFVTSSPFVAPCYHGVFAVLGAICSICIIKTAVNEMMGNLVAICVVWGLSETTMGLTLLAWGNSMGDVAANMALAKAGYGHMALAACFGGPILVTLLGGGLSFTIRAVDIGPKTIIDLDEKLIQCFFFLLCAVISFIICVPLFRFRARLSFGVFLLVIYSIFFVFSMLVEFDLIHALRCVPGQH